MSLKLHPALRVLGVGFGGLALLVLGTLAVYSGLRSLAQVSSPTPPAPVPMAPPVQNYIARPTAARARVPLLVRQSHGDWGRLSSADQQMLNAMTAGHGRAMLLNLAQQQAERERRQTK